MFKYSRAILNKIVREIGFLIFISKIVVNLFSIIYPIYSIIVGNGIVAVNIILSLLSLGMLVFVILIDIKKDTQIKRISKKYKRISKAIMLVTKMIPVGIAIYGLAIVGNETDVLSTIFVVCTVVAWAIQVLLELVKLFIETRVRLLVDGVRLDLDFVIKIANKLNRNQDGDDGEISEKNRQILELELEKFQEEKKLKREKKTEEKKLKKVHS